METRMLIYALIAIVLIMLASISGVIFLQKTFRDWLKKNLPILISFSAGVFFLIAINLAVESFEILEASPLPLFSIIAGIAFFVLLKVFWPESHHHDSECVCHNHTKPRAIRMMTGDAIHNLADGFIVISAFVIDLRLGIVTAISIFIHELLQEISEFFVLRDAGYSTKEALIRNFFVSTTIIIGAVLGLFLSQNATALGILLGIASGSFLYIVIVDLFPYNQMRESLPIAVKHLVSFAVGIIFVLILGLILGH